MGNEFWLGDVAYLCQQSLCLSYRKCTYYRPRVAVSCNSVLPDPFGRTMGVVTIGQGMGQHAHCRTISTCIYVPTAALAARRFVKVRVPTRLLSCSQVSCPSRDGCSRAPRIVKPSPQFFCEPLC